VLLRVATLQGRHYRYLSYEVNLYEGSCVHQGLSGSGLRHVDYLQVAWWIRSSASGYFHRVIGRFTYLLDSL
jgi:hypothetical protein